MPLCLKYFFLYMMALDPGPHILFYQIRQQKMMARIGQIYGNLYPPPCRLCSPGCTLRAARVDRPPVGTLAPAGAAGVSSYVHLCYYRINVCGEFIYREALYTSGKYFLDIQYRSIHK